MVRLYLIRHGETEGAESRRYKGHMDVPLSENGIRQMEYLARYIYQGIEHPVPRSTGQNTELSAVYTSDLSRAVRSAEIIASPYGIKPVIVKDLRERNFGIWEGMSFGEIKERYPEEFKAWAGNPLRFSPIRGESTLEVRDRALNALNKILNNHRKSSGMAQDSSTSKIVQNCSKLSYVEPLDNIKVLSIAIVSHGGINRVVLCHFLGMPLENIFRIEQDFGALNIIELWNEYPVVKLINYRAQNTP